MATTDPQQAHGASPASGGEHPEHAHTATPYVVIWLILCFLTGLTVWTGRMHLGNWALPLALLIATTKSLLVLIFFMHLKEDKGVNRMVVAVAVVFVLLLLGITLTDVATRFKGATPAGSPFGRKVHLPERAAGEPAGHGEHAKQ